MIVLWEIGDLAVNESATMDVVARLNPWVLSANMTSIAMVSGALDDPFADNNTAIVMTSLITTDLQVTKEALTQPVTYTDNVTWRITVTNLGDETATDVIVADPAFTSGMNILETSPSTGTVNSTAPDWADYFLTGWFLSLPIGQQAQ
jgi:uncharacterized repeat protein (TIGR01451 family)